MIIQKMKKINQQILRMIKKAIAQQILEWPSRDRKVEIKELKNISSKIFFSKMEIIKNILMWVKGGFVV